MSDDNSSAASAPLNQDQRRAAVCRAAARPIRAVASAASASAAAAASKRMRTSKTSANDDPTMQILESRGVTLEEAAERARAAEMTISDWAESVQNLCGPPNERAGDEGVEHY